MDFHFPIYFFIFHIEIHFSNPSQYLSKAFQESNCLWLGPLIFFMYSPFSLSECKAHFLSETFQTPSFYIRPYARYFEVSFYLHVHSICSSHLLFLPYFPKFTSCSKQYYLHFYLQPQFPLFSSFSHCFHANPACLPLFLFDFWGSHSLWPFLFDDRGKYKALWPDILFFEKKEIQHQFI